MICLAVVVAVVKIAQEIELQFIGVAFDALQAVVFLPGDAGIGAMAQLFHHRHHFFRGLVEQFEVALEIAPAQIFGTNQNALADFLDRLGNFVERGGQRLDVFAFQRE